MEGGRERGRKGKVGGQDLNQGKTVFLSINTRTSLITTNHSLGTDDYVALETKIIILSLSLDESP
jgi:hypothetical protein